MDEETKDEVTDKKVEKDPHDFEARQAKKVTVTVSYEYEDGDISSEIFDVRPQNFMLALYRPFVQVPGIEEPVRAQDTLFMMHGQSRKE